MLNLSHDLTKDIETKGMQTAWSVKSWHVKWVWPLVPISARPYFHLNSLHALFAKNVYALVCQVLFIAAMEHDTLYSTVLRVQVLVSSLRANPSPQEHMKDPTMLVQFC